MLAESIMFGGVGSSIQTMLLRTYVYSANSSMATEQDG